MVQALPAAIAVAGSVVKGLGTAKAHRANARTEETNAIAELNDGVAREAQIRDAARMSMGQLAAAQGENGFTPGTGSALDALAQSQINATLDTLTARREAMSRARARQAAAANERRSGKNALISMGFDVANTLTGMKDWGGGKS